MLSSSHPSLHQLRETPALGYLSLRDQGVSRIVFTTKGGDPKLTSNGLFLGSQDFLDKYPDIALRVLKQFVVAAKLLADAEKDPTPVFQLWTKNGFTFSGFKEDWTGEDLKYRTSPLVDTYVASRYRLQIDEAQRFGLTRRSFSFEEWTDLRSLKQALQQLGLEQYWKPRGLDGKPSG